MRFFEDFTNRALWFLLRPFLASERQVDNHICVALQGFGIDAQIAEQGRPEKDIECGFWTKSFGLVDVPDGPIRWVYMTEYSPGPENSDFFIKYGVPDAKLGPNSPKSSIRSIIVNRKDGQDLQWEGKDSYGIIGRLNSDGLTNQTIKTEKPSSGRWTCRWEVNIRAHGKHGCWVISTETSDAPTEELWNCYQTIAGHLLAAETPSS